MRHPRESISVLVAALVGQLIGGADTGCVPSQNADVVVIGGGAGGAHAAFQLQETYGKKVILIEKQAILGGCVDTYIDPATGDPINYGVQTFVDLGDSTTSFFDALGVAYTTPTEGSLPGIYADFSTGEGFNFTGPTYPQELAALSNFVDVVAPWEEFLRPGFFNFPPPDDIPSDLLLPFGELATKYGFEDAIGLIYQTTAFGMGNVSEQISMYVLQAFGAPIARAFLGQAQMYTVASGSNQDLYDAVAQRLGQAVMYSSTVVASQRSDQGVSLKVQNSVTGETTQINAKKLVVAIPPTPENIAPLDLDEEETRVFANFDFSILYPALVKNSALPVNQSVNDLPLSASPDNVYAYQDRPFVIDFKYFTDDIFHTVAIGQYGNMTAQEAVALIQSDFNKLVASGVLEKPDNEELDFVAFTDHGAMHSRVSAEAVQAGFIQDLYGLLGKKSTWWAGAAFSAQLQTDNWAYNDVMLPMLNASMYL